MADATAWGLEGAPALPCRYATHNSTGITEILMVIMKGEYSVVDARETTVGTPTACLLRYAKNK